MTTTVDQATTSGPASAVVTNTKSTILPVIAIVVLDTNGIGL